MNSPTFPCLTDPTKGSGDFVLSGRSCRSTLSRPLLSFFSFLSTEFDRGGEESPFANRLRTACDDGDERPWSIRKISP